MSDRTVKLLSVAMAACFALTGLFHEDTGVFGSEPAAVIKFIESKVPFLWIAALLASSLVLRRPEGSSVPRAAWVALGVGLVGLAAISLASHWDRVRLQCDSCSYVEDSARPLGYPWFLKAVQGADEFSKTERFGTNEPNGYETAVPSAAAMRAVRVQKILFWGSWIFFALSLAWSSGRAFGLTACFCVLLYRFDWFGTGMLDFLMSETLSSAMLHLLFGFAALAGATRSAWYLPPAALAFAVAVLARMAAGFGIVILLAATVMVVAAHWRRPRYLLAPFGLVALIGVGSLYLAHRHCYERNGYYALSPLGQYERVAFALEVADDADAERIADPDARRVFVLARQFREKRRQVLGWTELPMEEMQLNLNCWQSAVPGAMQVFRELNGEPVESQQKAQAFAVEVFRRISDTVLPLHRDRRLAIYKRYVSDALQKFTRLRYTYLSARSGRIETVSFFAIFGLAIGACVVGRNLAAVAALSCLGAFTLFILGMCLYEQPLSRYLEFAEWIGLTGFYLAGLSMVGRIGQWLGSVTWARDGAFGERWRRLVEAVRAPLARRG